MSRTKIVATLGPASGEAPVLRAMLDAGLDVARINFSHGNAEEHSARLAALRSAAAGRYVGVLGDLCGPKIRVTHLPATELHLGSGEELVVKRTADQGLGPRQIVTGYPGLVDDVEPGHRLLIDDGAIQCHVKSKGADVLVCECESGGVIRMGKGLNFPDSVLKIPRMSRKDFTDLDWAIAHELDFLGLSFVQTAADVEAWREALAQRGGQLRLVTKIETPAAVRNIDAIIERSDAILVARGDLGVEVDLVEVPVIQKDIVRRCQAAGVPVIVATQMLQSMVDSPRPTRAEVSDVANAILDGADAVMLSAETAVGKYPTAAVECMNRIIARTEAAGELAGRPVPRIEQPALKVTSAVARTAALAAREHGAKAVVVWTRTGNTARLVSKHHLPQPVLAFSPDEQVCRRLALLAGVNAARVDRPPDERTLLQTVDRELIRRGWARQGDMVVVVAGTDRTTPGASDAVILHFVEDEPTGT